MRNNLSGLNSNENLGTVNELNINKLSLRKLSFVFRINSNPYNFFYHSQYKLQKELPSMKNQHK